jgi:DNA-binding MarR family transcriptional regulator
MKKDFSQHFGFLVNEVGRLYSRAFDKQARGRLGLSRAQVRLIGTLAANGPASRPSQSELAERLDLTSMGVASLCTRMQASGWLRRKPSPSDRRVNEIQLEPVAHQALAAALAISDEIQDQALAGLSEAQQAQLVRLLRKVHANLTAERHELA